MPQKGSSFAVYTDHSNTAALLDYEVVYCRGICQGRKFTIEQWNETVESEMQRNARNLALKLLTGRDMPSGALYKKLTERGIEPQTAAKTVARCIELGEVNDERYALRAAEYCLNNKRYGANRAYQWMIQKGIPRELAKQAIAEVSPQIDSTEQLKVLIEKRYAEKLATGDYRQKQNVIAALIRRGYRIGEIQLAVSEYLAEQQET